MTVIFDGFLAKLHSTYANPVEYSLGDLPLNPLIGTEIRLHFSKEIECIHCSRSIKKTFGQGYCYPCFTTLARCDSCIVRPEKCHYHLGTCREPEWGKTHCLIPHSVYIASSNGLKVGITRSNQKRTRWIDQGAFAALEILQVDQRLAAGLAEVVLKSEYAERTDWRGLLTGARNSFDLVSERERIIEDFSLAFEEAGAQISLETDATEIVYPVLEYLPKAKTLNLDKQHEISGKLLGIRGQYLLIGTMGLNIRKFQGYRVRIEQ